MITYDLELELQRKHLKENLTLTNQEREWLREMLLDKYSVKICAMSDEQLMYEGRDHGIF